MTVPEFIASITAISALIFSGWSLVTQRKHNKLSVKPHLTLNHKWDQGVRKVFLKNSGLGPAIVVKHELQFQDKSIPFHSGIDIEHLAEGFLGPGFYSAGYSIDKNQVIEPGDNINFLGLYWHDDHEYQVAKDTVIDFLQKAQLIVHYKSMYGQQHELKRSLVCPDDYNI